MIDSDVVELPEGPFTIKQVEEMLAGLDTRLAGIDVAAVRERVGGRHIITSMSGGKDSATADMLMKLLGLPHSRVFIDTAWEHPQLYHYVMARPDAHHAIRRGWGWPDALVTRFLDEQDRQHGTLPLQAALGSITIIRSPMSMRELVMERGMFPSRQRRFCTQELKVFPMQAYIALLAGAEATLLGMTDDGAERWEVVIQEAEGRKKRKTRVVEVKGDLSDLRRARAGEVFDVVNVVGIRHQESNERKQALEWEWSPGFDCEVWRPIIHFTLDDVIAMHHRNQVKPCPLYLMGYARVGCAPCINIRKSEMRLLADTFPEAIDRVRDLEADVEGPARERYERDAAAWAKNPDPEPKPEDHDTAEDFEDARAAWESKQRRLTSPFVSPRWFQAMIGRKGMWPIDEVVRWSHTQDGGRGGGRQFEWFAAPPRDAGCMRWGMCDTGTASYAREV